MQNFRIILVEPRTPGNIGACARLAANFECRDWMIVNSQCDWGGWDAKKYATGASEAFLERFRAASSLREALADCDSAIGFTRRVGRSRIPSVELPRIAELPGKRIALVFGNEETGLSREDISLCAHLCMLPTSETMPSMNLSHAVAVVLARLAEVHGTSHRPRVRGKSPIASVAQIAGLMDHWRELLVDAGLTTSGNPDRLVTSLRGIFGRAALTEREARAIRGVLSKVQVKLGTRSRGRRVN